LVEHKTDDRDYVEWIYDAEPANEQSWSTSVRGAGEWPKRLLQGGLLAVGWVVFNVGSGALELALLGGHLLRRELAQYAQSLGRPSLAPWLQSGGKDENRLTSGDES
jgi:hypothetical protein